MRGKFLPRLSKIPAFAGMTDVAGISILLDETFLHVIPAKAGIQALKD